MESHSSSYVPSSLAKGLPPPLCDLFKPEHLEKSFEDLLQLPEDTEVVVTLDQSKAVEEETRTQANSRLWFRMRAGRITASKLKAVCSTDPAMPSVSLILSICHPEMSKFCTAAMKWGCEHEQIARSKYCSLYSATHEKISVAECGFFIPPSFAFMGTSPDGLISCLCCGDGLCEVMVCIHLYKFFPALFVVCFIVICNSARSVHTVTGIDPLKELQSFKHFCLEKSDGSHNLKQNHPYYYQVKIFTILCHFIY